MRESSTRASPVAQRAVSFACAATLLLPPLLLPAAAAAAPPALQACAAVLLAAAHLQLQPLQRARVERLVQLLILLMALCVHHAAHAAAAGAKVLLRGARGGGAAAQRVWDSSLPASSSASAVCLLPRSAAGSRALRCAHLPEVQEHLLAAAAPLRLGGAARLLGAGSVRRGRGRCCCGRRPVLLAAARQATRHTCVGQRWRVRQGPGAAASCSYLQRHSRLICCSPLDAAAACCCRLAGALAALLPLGLLEQLLQRGLHRSHGARGGGAKGNNGLSWLRPATCNLASSSFRAVGHR